MANKKWDLAGCFLQACEDHDLVKVKACIELGLSVNILSKDKKKSGLWIAAERNNSELLEFLLSQPDINVNIATFGGGTWAKHWTVLMQACFLGYHNIVRRLCQVENIDCNVVDDDGYSALLLSGFRCILKTRATSFLNDIKQHIIVEVVEILKTQDVNWNVQSSKGWSPATLALKRKNVEVLKAILSVPGLDLNLKTHKGSTVASMAVAQGCAEIIEILSSVDRINWNETRKGVPLIISALREDKHDIVNFLLETKGVDPNVKDLRGDSLATIGVKKNNLEFLRRLNEIPGLDWNTRNRAGDCPLSLAVKQELIEVLRFLKSLPETNLHVTDGKGRSLEKIALDTENIEILKLVINYERVSDNLVLSAVFTRKLEFLTSLKDKGGFAELWNMKCDGDTPVLRALKFEEFDAVKLLLSVAEVDVNEVDSWGQSLAELAAFKNYQELLELMLKVDRLNWSSKNQQGNTPIMTAMIAGNLEIVKLLLSHPEKIEPSLRNNNGQTLEDIARELGLKNILKLIPGSPEKKLKEMEDHVARLDISHSIPECPVCFEKYGPDSQVYQCGLGHFVCQDCRPMLKACPTCRGQITGRSHGFEQFLRSLDSSAFHNKGKH